MCGWHTTVGTRVRAHCAPRARAQGAWASAPHRRHATTVLMAWLGYSWGGVSMSYKATWLHSRSICLPSDSLAMPPQYCQLLSDYGPPSAGYTQGAGISQEPHWRVGKRSNLPTWSKNRIKRLNRGIIHSRKLVSAWLKPNRVLYLCCFWL